MIEEVCGMKRKRRRIGGDVQYRIGQHFGFPNNVTPSQRTLAVKVVEEMGWPMLHRDDKMSIRDWASKVLLSTY
jgi:hypothetical protein